MNEKNKKNTINKKQGGSVPNTSYSLSAILFWGIFFLVAYFLFNFFFDGFFKTHRFDWGACSYVCKYHGKTAEDWHWEYFILRLTVENSLERWESQIGKAPTENLQEALDKGASPLPLDLLVRPSMYSK